jgi:hypothetical protein
MLPVKRCFVENPAAMSFRQWQKSHQSHVDADAKKASASWILTSVTSGEMGLKVQHLDEHGRRLAVRLTGKES